MEYLKKSLSHVMDALVHVAMYLFLLFVIDYVGILTVMARETLPFLSDGGFDHILHNEEDIKMFIFYYFIAFGILYWFFTRIPRSLFILLCSFMIVRFCIFCLSEISRSLCKASSPSKKKLDSKAVGEKKWMDTVKISCVNDNEEKETYYDVEEDDVSFSVPAPPTDDCSSTCAPWWPTFTHTDVREMEDDVMRWALQETERKRKIQQEIVDRLLPPSTFRFVVVPDGILRDDVLFHYKNNIEFPFEFTLKIVS